MKRRPFLKTLGVTAAVLASGAIAGYLMIAGKPIPMSKPTPAPSPSPTVSNPQPSLPTPSPTPTSKPTNTDLIPVSIVIGPSTTNRLDLVEMALDSIGGVNNILPKQSNVLVKPNVGWYSKNANTDPEVVAAISNLIKRFNSRRIVVAESSVRGYDTSHAFEVSGITQAVSEVGVEVKDLTKDNIESIEVPNGVAVQSIDTWRTVVDSNFIVSVPRLKRHGNTTVTISLKNMMGLITHEEKGRFHRVNLNQCIADLNSSLTPRLVVIDATKVMVERGPTGGRMIESNMIIASTDPVAADLIAAQKLFELEGSVSPEEKANRIDHIRRAAELGVGSNDLSKIKVVEKVIHE